MRDERQTLGLRLSYKHAVERVSMMERKTGNAFRMREADEKLLEPTVEDSRFQAFGYLEAAQGGFDGSLPGGCHADEDDRGIGDAGPRFGRQARRFSAPPEEHVRVKE